MMKEAVVGKISVVFLGAGVVVVAVVAVFVAM